MDKKSRLKEIRGCLDAGDEDSAWKMIELLIAANETDYFLFIFAAICQERMKNGDEANKFLKKAIALDSTKLPAWQGMLKLYEDRLIPLDPTVIHVVDTLMEHNRDNLDKMNMYKRKKIQFLLTLGHFSLLQCDNVDDCTMIVSFIGEKTQWVDEERLLLSNCFEQLRKENHFDGNTHRFYCLFLSTVSCYETSRENFQTRLVSEWFPIAVEHYRDWDQSPWSASFLLKAHALLFFESHSIPMESLVLLKDSSFSHNESILYSLLEFLSTGDTVGAMDMVQENWPLPWPGCVVAIPLLRDHECYEMIRDTIDQVLLLDDIHNIQWIRCLLHDELAWALYGIGDPSSLDRTKRLVLDLLASNGTRRSLVILAVRIAADEGQLTEAATQLESFGAIGDSEHLFATAYIRWKTVGECVLVRDENDQGSLTKAIEAIESALVYVEEEGQRAEYLWLLAECLLSIDNTDSRALTVLVEAARFNPNSSLVFTRLGQLFLEKNNLVKARKCLERAISIRPQRESTARIWDRLLYSQHVPLPEQLEHLQRFSAITSLVPQWTSQRIAFIHLQLGNHKAALDQLQSLVRADLSNATLWQCLGEAYRALGNVPSAIKALTEALRLLSDEEEETDGMNLRVELAQLYMRMGMYDEAMRLCSPSVNLILHLQCLLMSIDDGGGMVTFARQFNVLRRFFDAVQSVDGKGRGGEGGGGGRGSPLEHQLMGTALLKLARFRDEQIRQVFKGNHVTRLGILDRALNHFSWLVSLCPKRPRAWNHLGLALLEKFSLTNDNNCHQRAIECFVRAIRLTRSKTSRCDDLWTNLGIACSLKKSQLALAQHSLVRALQINPRFARSWCQLGLIYFVSDEINAGHEALKMAQSCDPSLSESWSSQALIAERLRHHDTTDLFRHSLTLKSTRLASSKYAFRLVDDMIKSGCPVDEACGLVALDALSRLNELVDDDDDDDDDDSFLCLTALFQSYFGLDSCARRILTDKCCQEQNKAREKKTCYQRLIAFLDQALTTNSSMGKSSSSSPISRLSSIDVESLSRRDEHRLHHLIPWFPLISSSTSQIK